MSYNWYFLTIVVLKCSDGKSFRTVRLSGVGFKAKSSQSACGQCCHFIIWVSPSVTKPQLLCSPSPVADSFITGDFWDVPCSCRASHQSNTSLVEAEDEVSAAESHTDLVWLTVNNDSLSSQPLKPADIVNLFSLLPESSFDPCVLQILAVKYPVWCSLGACHSLISLCLLKAQGEGAFWQPALIGCSQWVTVALGRQCQCSTEALVSRAELCSSERVTEGQSQLKGVQLPQWICTCVLDSHKPSSNICGISFQTNTIL